MSNLSAATPYILAAVSLVVGVIGFFLKRTVARVEDTEKQVSDIKENFAKKEDLDRVVKTSEQAYSRLEKRIDERFDKIDGEVKAMKREHLLKEDFYREMAKQDAKMDRIIQMLMQRKGSE